MRKWINCTVIILVCLHLLFQIHSNLTFYRKDLWASILFDALNCGQSLVLRARSPGPPLEKMAASAAAAGSLPGLCPSYAVICSFLERYGPLLDLPELTFTQLERYFLDTSSGTVWKPPDCCSQIGGEERLHRCISVLSFVRVVLLCGFQTSLCVLQCFAAIVCLRCTFSCTYMLRWSLFLY